MLVVAIEESLDLRAWQVIGEFLVNLEPGRIDAVVIRRTVRMDEELIPLLPALLSDLVAHNVIHLKGATDSLEAVDALQAAHYALGYMLAAGVLSPADVSIRVVAPTLTDAFAAQVRALGGSLAESSRPGVHAGELHGFALRVVETTRAAAGVADGVLQMFTPAYLRGEVALRPVDERERALYARLARCIHQRWTPREVAMIKDIEEVRRRFMQDMQYFMARMGPKAVAANLTPEQIAALEPEQLTALPEVARILALPEATLRALPADYLATLPTDAQATIRARLAR